MSKTSDTNTVPVYVNMDSYTLPGLRLPDGVESIALTAKEVDVIRAMYWLLYQYETQRARRLHAWLLNSIHRRVRGGSDG